MSELEMELDEHTMVLNALTPLEPERRCHRRVGAILMETTVEKVIPNITEIIKGVFFLKSSQTHLLTIFSFKATLTQQKSN